MTTNDWPANFAITADWHSTPIYYPPQQTFYIPPPSNELPALVLRMKERAEWLKNQIETVEGLKAELETINKLLAVL